MKSEEEIIEQIASAHRPRHPSEIAPHPRFYDAAPESREKAFHLAHALRALEAALDAEGLSTTARAVLARL